jgi:hypothetical protein
MNPLPKNKVVPKRKVAMPKKKAASPMKIRVILVLHPLSKRRVILVLI